MTRRLRLIALAALLLGAISSHPALAQKSGGVLRQYMIDSPAKLIDRQSMEPNQDKRKTLVWEIERRLAEDAARPMIFYAGAANCWRPEVKGLTIPINGIYNGWRMEDSWLDK